MTTEKEKSKFSLVHYRRDERIVKLVSNTDQKTLAHWAIDCAERVLPYFEEHVVNPLSWTGVHSVISSRPGSQSGLLCDPLGLKLGRGQVA